jgi:ATP-dependent DNA ligase
VVGSLLLGLYNAKGLRDHVGFTSSLAAADRPELTKCLAAAKAGLLVEVSFDHVSSRLFRHGPKFLGWRPDKAPKQCTMDQLAQGNRICCNCLEYRPERGYAVSLPRRDSEIWIFFE